MQAAKCGWPQAGASWPNLGPILANLRQVAKVRQSEAKFGPVDINSGMSGVSCNQCRFFEQTALAPLSKQCALCNDDDDDDDGNDDDDDNV